MFIQVYNHHVGTFLGKHNSNGSSDTAVASGDDGNLSFKTPEARIIRIIDRAWFHFMLHAGLPVTRGVKYLASRWIRATPFHYPPPRPLLDL